MSDYIIVHGQLKDDGVWYTCPGCQARSLISLENIGFQTMVRCCSVVFKVQYNRRKNPIQRMMDGYSVVTVVGWKNGQFVLADYDNGGIGLVAEGAGLKNFTVDQEVVIRYTLCGTQVESRFIVRSILGKRIGLMYRDGQGLNPGQRVIVDAKCKK